MSDQNQAPVRSVSTWTAGYDSGHRIGYEEGRKSVFDEMRAYLAGKPDEPVRKAAPAMLRALREIDDTTLLNGDRQVMLERIRDLARAAIAKTEGQS